MNLDEKRKKKEYVFNILSYLITSIGFKKYNKTIIFLKHSIEKWQQPSCSITLREFPLNNKPKHKQTKIFQMSYL